MDGITHLQFDAVDGTASTPAVDGTIPYTLTNFPRLQHFSTGSNRGICGTIPSEIGQLGDMVSLILGTQSINGTLPTELGQLSKLKTLWAQCVDLTGTIPTEFGTLTALQDLHLGCRRQGDLRYLTGTIPTEIGRLVDLTGLSLWNNALTGALPLQPRAPPTVAVDAAGQWEQALRHSSFL
jgi:hypothetical protein